MFRLSTLTTAITFALCVEVSLASTDAAKEVSRSLLEQARALPAEFSEHFFDVPLAVRVELDQRFMGEAMITLSRDDRVVLIDFTDTHGVAVEAAVREQWQAVLQDGLPLGACQAQCPAGLLAVHYSLESSLLSILTVNAERNAEVSRFQLRPEGGSSGLMLRNQLNLSGGQQQNSSGRYDVQATGSLGNWTQTFNGQLAKLGGTDEPLHHAVYELHSQRELEGQFLRLGYFTPSFLGISRQPRTFGVGPDTALGVMVGSSDSLEVVGKKSAIYPVFVTANREAVAEIYRDNVLINSQPIRPGLQSLDTSVLPNGIYEVEVRLIEDGQLTSRSEELVYKPGNWRNPEQRLRYNGFVGRESKLLSNWDNQDDGSLTVGGAVNYLLHPRLIGGVSARQVKDDMQYGSSLDWTLTDKASLFANVYQTDGHGTGMDLHSLYRYASGSVNFNHTRSWLDTRNTYETLPDGTRLRQRNTYNGAVSNSSLSVNHRLAPQHSVSARLSHSEGNVEGVGLDLSWMRTSRLFESDANWQVSVFDRPASNSSGYQRNRGVDLSLSLALGGENSRVSGSLGSRTARDGSNDRNGSLTYEHSLQDSPLTTVSATAISDTYGTGLAGRAGFSTQWARGDAYVQQSSFNNSLSGGLNLDSSVIIGGGKVAMTSQYTGDQAGMIVDVESDLDAISLRADDLSGMGAVLKPGRNFVPVAAYQASSVQFDFQGNDAHAASIQPARARYHLNKGGVSYQKVRVMKTLTVLGRLVDAQGQPLKGHHVINHASRGVSEVDGFFSMEMSESTPTLEVQRNTEVLCRFKLDPSRHQRENDVLMVGDLRCVPEALAQVASPKKSAG
jgi:hypothetical protein